MRVSLAWTERGSAHFSRSMRRLALVRSIACLDRAGKRTLAQFTMDC